MLHTAAKVIKPEALIVYSSVHINVALNTIHYVGLVNENTFPFPSKKINSIDAFSFRILTKKREKCGKEVCHL